ncbi:glycosyltransferase family 4 protein [Microvirga sp. VF16]|uniref:glycosyltransferase family 4 protein n=1 Tax=Microvirga sp. VF16 TaxID=2807101 RepID=UPI00193E4E29|nr:glycosyltransferase family 4 protein [Microvirga sp. VF16]QRM33401.1 glycosyltransferase family 4 protein [Microvirga sp. VF16]
MTSKTNATFGPILFPFTGSTVGGSHISAFHLARSLAADHGIKGIVLAAPASNVARQAAEMGLDVHSTGDAPAKARDPVADIARLSRRVRTLKSYGPGAIVHCNDIWSLQSWGIAGRMLGLPLVYHHRALLRMRWFDRALVRQSQGIITISDSCRHDLGFLPANYVRCVLNPFPDPMLEPPKGWQEEFRAHAPEDAEPILIGFIGNFQFRKRPDFFLDVCAAIAAREPRARFVIFGRERNFQSGDLESRAADLGIANRLILAGFRSPPEMNIATLDILLAPAFGEPFGRTLVEALLLGVPFVATDDAGHSEIVARWSGGILVEPHATVDEFADAAMRVLAEPKDVILSLDARRKVAEELSPRTHAARIMDVYRNISGARG